MGVASRKEGRTMLSEELRGNPLYVALRDSALVTITPHEIDPSIGYFIVCPLGQSGPYPTPEAALVGLLLALYKRVREAER